MTDRNTFSANMWRYSCTVVLLCTIALGTDVVNALNSRLPVVLFGRPVGGFLNGGWRNSKLNKPGILAERMKFTEYYIEQPIDHANPSLGTWKQRVQYNPIFYKNEELIFLMIGGESPIAEKWIADPSVTYLKWAKQYGAAVFQLEHRFFGKSRPYDNLKTSSLKYCTVDQALKDLESFIKQTNKKYNYKNPKWVTFGGSYPGALNAWFRREHPELTIGAVASSAPLTYYLDYFGYAMVMDDVLRETAADCHKLVGESFTAILNKALTEKGRSELSETLRLNPAFNEKTLTVMDIHNFVAFLFGLFQGVVQYTYDGRDKLTRGGLNVRNLCNIITNAPTSDPVERMEAVIEWIYKFYPDPNDWLHNGTLTNSYKELIDVLKNTTFDDENNDENAATRGWMWLCCNELGVMQTTDQGRNVFGSMLPLDYYIDICMDMFGDDVNITWVRDRNTAFRNKYKDGEDYKASNIVLPNGSLDPFYPIGTYVNYPDVHQKTILIKGTAHCADMYPVWSGEPPALAPARAEIQKELEYFIAPTSTGTSITANVASTLLLASLLLAITHQQ